MHKRFIEITWSPAQKSEGEHAECPNIPYPEREC